MTAMACSVIEFGIRNAKVGSSILLVSTIQCSKEIHKAPQNSIDISVLANNPSKSIP